ncbi:MAG: hypothetical protein K9I99_12985 [Melioribacteraceae bacterium]|nr:hypothetical protein [Melioribacteraceae bacterium]
MAKLNLWPNLSEIMDLPTDYLIVLTLTQVQNGIGALQYDTQINAGEYLKFYKAVQKYLK